LVLFGIVLLVAVNEAWAVACVVMVVVALLCVLLLVVVVLLGFVGFAL
jgi:hypothetical protein